MILKAKNGPDMRPEDFFSLYAVSEEQAQKFSVYHDLLLKWQRAINLVGPSTIKDVWLRHFHDSAQLSPFIDQNARVADLGSGAGFPGLVLAILRPDLEVLLVERDERKAQFLKNVSRETLLSNVTVFDSDIREISANYVPDVVTARALASLPQLLGFCENRTVKNPDLQMLFLKGRRVEEEIEGAFVKYDFQYELTSSVTDKDAFVLQIWSLQRKV